jgi:glutamate-5-semialdehyde dehydrogenase
MGLSSGDLEKMLAQMRAGAKAQRKIATALKNQALETLAKALITNSAEILRANKLDVDGLPADTLPAFRDRLLLNPKRLEGMAESLRQVAALPDPVGEVVESKTLANGLKLRRVRAPLGVLFMIFESRPNVILEAFSLAFKSGNVIILRGGSESSHTSQALYKMMRDSLSESGLTDLPFYGFDDYDRKHVETLLKRHDKIDIVVPRGGEKLIAYVQSNATMPVIKNDRGLCHAYVSEDADLEMAARIVTNAKVQRPGVCNSLETVLVHRAVAEKFIPALYKMTEPHGLKWHADKASLGFLAGKANTQAATPENWDTEYLDLVLNCAVVAGLDEALAHIEKHGSRHSETIITADEKKARRFQEEVDAAAVYWNASTRFTDGFEFGLGGELGISTQKLHVRGPVGLRELTTPRWIGDGNGQVRE